VIVLLTCFLLPSCVRPPEKEDETAVEKWRRENSPAIDVHLQVMGGVSMLGDAELGFEDPIGDGSYEPTQVDLPTAPILGFAVQGPLLDDVVDLGIEGGITMSWWVDNWAFRSADGVTVIAVDNWFFMGDLFLGGYASTELFDAFRLYAGAGPLVTLGLLDVDRDEIQPTGTVTINENLAGLGLGLYARGGVEVQLARNAFLGLGVRGIRTDIGFGGSVGDVEIEGIQGLITYTIRY
jgi:hypothetical protein